MTTSLTKRIVLLMLILLGAVNISKAQIAILDPSFAHATGFNGDVFALALQADGKVLVGGAFTSYNGTTRNRMARLNADGSLDTSFDIGTGFSSVVATIAVQADGKVMVGGTFTSYNGTGRNRIARLNADGSLDDSFIPGTGFSSSSTVYALALQADGKVMVGGIFTSYNGTGRNRIARLNADGSLDDSFIPGTGFNLTVSALALQADGKVLVGGEFASYNGVSRNRIARLNADGSLDASFDPGTGFNNTVSALALQADGKVLVGGAFTSYKGTSRNHIARLNADGSLDASFNPGTVFNNPVYALALQADGKVLRAGNYIARLNADGTWDPSFYPHTMFNNAVRVIVLQPDGKVLAGGLFTSYNLAPRNRIARIIPPLSASISSKTDINCKDGSTGEATVATTGGTSPYTYSWNTTPAAQTTATATGLTAGTYEVTVTDNNGITTTATVTLTEPALALSATISGQTNVIVFGGSTGEATVAATGGTAPYSYSWNTTPAQTNATATNLPAGTYEVTVTDANTCITTATATITQPGSALSASISSQTDIACKDGSTGEATVTATGGTAPYTYSWDTTPEQTTATATGLTAGTYEVTVTDANGITTTATVTLTEPALALSASISGQTNVIVFGGATGEATVAATGGTSPYSYSWNTTPAQTNSTATNLPAGTYEVTVTDNNGCITTATATITQPGSALSASISSQTDINCKDGSTGEATVTATGGTAPYTYSWDTTPEQTTATATGLRAGTYEVTVTDANLVTTTATVTLTEPAAALSATISGQTNVIVFGGATGEATVAATGGTSPYSYSWDTTPAQTNSTATNLLAGTYEVTVRDAKACITTATATITQPVSALTASISSKTDINCKGGSTGEATVAATGGTAPYTYSWDTTPEQTTATATGLTAGTYEVTVRDANGVTTTATVTLTEPALALSATISGQTNVIVFGGSTGEATVTATGGTSPYSYIWDTAPEQTNATATNLPAGTYEVTVTDANTCITTATATITQPGSALSASISSQTDIACKDGSTGEATVTATGGTAPYTYSWNSSPEQTTATATNLPAGTYEVTVTDNNGVTTTATVTLTEPALALSATISGQTNVIVFGGSTGEATVAATGGTSPYSYSWNTTPAQTAATATNLVAGTYEVTVTDANTCITTATATITQPASALSASISSQTDINCKDGSTGEATVTATGGTAPYTYSWDTTPEQTTATATNLPAGTYEVTVTDANGVTTTATVTLTNPAAPASVITPDGPTELCEDDLVSLTATEGVSYLWSTGETSRTITMGMAGTYKVTVISALGCQSEADITVKKKICNLPPVAVCKPLIVLVANADCYAVLTPRDIDGGSYDPNGDWTRHSLLNTDGIFRPGNYTVTYEVMDPKGAVSTYESQVQVVDHTPPVALARSLKLELNAAGQASISVDDVDDGSYDNCGPVSLRLNRTTFDCSDLGHLQVRLTVTDASGNVAEALSDITIVDNTPPVISATDLTLALDENGRAVISNESLITGISDNCGIWNVSVSHNEFTCEHVGKNEVVITVEDVQGNRSTATVIVTVEDNTPPVVRAKDITLYLNKDGKASLTTVMIDEGSEDNCGIRSLSIGREVFDCADLGEQTQTLTATDAAGNIATATFTVTVRDTLAPVVLAKEITLYLNASGRSYLTPDDIDEGSSDNCGIASRNLDNTVFDCKSVGVQSVQYTVADGSGNSTTVIIQVTVSDTTAPEVITQNLVLELDGDGKATLSADDIDGGSSDNCGIATKSISQTNFTCSDLGRRLVTLTVRDENGNQSTDKAVLEVKDPNGACPCSYGVLAFNGTTMEKNTVSAGGVGVINSGKKVKLRKTVINREGTFIRAPQSNFDSESEASIYIRGAAPQPEAFRSNAHKDKNRKKAGNGGSLTLTAGRYGKVKAGKSATITFSGGDIYIRSLKVKKNVRLVFSDNTVLLVRNGVRLGRNSAFNTGGEQVRLYAGSGITIGNASEVRSVLHSEGKLKTRGGDAVTSMEGLFIANKIRGGRNTHWAGGGLLCTGNEDTGLMQTSRKELLRTKTDEALTSLADSSQMVESLHVNVSPNPASDRIQVKIESDTDGGELLLADLQGNVLLRKTFSGNQTVQELSIGKYPAGIYVIRVSSGDRSRTVRVFKE